METPPSENRSVRACAACQKYKRRCDKALPCCSLCTRLGRHCDYSAKQVENHLRARIQELERIVSSNTASPPASTPGNFGQSVLRHQRIFIDSDIRQGPREVTSPAESVMIPPAVIRELGDESQQAAAASHYFETVHKWMPIISQTRLAKFAKTSQAKHRADYALLLLSMKLIQQVPQSTVEASQSPLYAAFKELLFGLDSAAVHSILKLQASVLITVYEMGHGIFPSAYMSMGYCVTHAVALGIHKSTAPQILEVPRNWVDWEERQRVWWMIVILDRNITMGGDNRPLFTEDPSKSSHLPADDDAWNRGQSVPPERLFISSPTGLSASPFARVVQASHLLGKVIRHCNDEEPQDLNAVQDEVELLYQSICALLDLLTTDRESVLRFQNAVAICLSGLMKLADHHSCDSFATKGQETLDMAAMALARDITERCRVLLDRAIVQILSFVDILAHAVKQPGSAGNPSTFSPLLLHCVYRAIAAQAWMGSASSAETANRYATGKEKCKEMLQQANTRWKLAGAYLDAAETVENDLELGQY